MLSITGDRLVPILGFDSKTILCPLPQNAPVGSSNRTLEFWFRSGFQSLTRRDYVFYGSDSAGLGFGVGASSNTPGTNLQYNVGGTAVFNIVNADSHAVDGAYHHVALVHANGYNYFYLDGELVASSSHTLNTPSGGNMIIGQSYGDIRVCEVRLWNYARSCQEIVDNMNTRMVGNESGLTIYLPLDEGSNSNVRNRVTNDLCTVNGSPSWTSANLPSSGLDFKFSGGMPKTSSRLILPPGKREIIGSRKVLTFPGHATGIVNCGTFDPFTGDFAIALWIRRKGIPLGYPTNQTSYRASPLGKATEWNSSSTRWLIESFDRYATWGIQHYNANAWYAYGLPHEFAHHLVTRSGGNTDFYYNGRKIATKTTFNTLGPNTSAPVTLGGYGTSPICNPFRGQLMDVRIWNRALSSAEAMKVYRGGRVPNGLQAHWPLNDGAGNTVKDISGNDRHGTIIGRGIVWKTPQYEQPCFYPWNSSERRISVRVPSLQNVKIQDVPSGYSLTTVPSVLRTSNTPEGYCYLAYTGKTYMYLNSTNRVPECVLPAWYHPSRKMYLEINLKLNGSADASHRYIEIRLVSPGNPNLDVLQIAHGKDSYSDRISGLQYKIPYVIRTGTFLNNTDQTLKIWVNFNNGEISLQLDNSEKRTTVDSSLITREPIISPKIVLAGWYTTHECLINSIVIKTYD